MEHLLTGAGKLNPKPWGYTGIAIGTRSPTFPSAPESVGFGVEGLGFREVV